MKESKKMRIATLLICMALVLLCVFLERFVKADVLKRPEHTIDAIQNEEKTQETVLSSEVIYEDDELLCYSDRILSKFYIGSNHAENVKEKVKGILEKCEEIEFIYVLPVPLPILLEESVEEQYNSYIDFIEELSLGKEEKIRVIDTLPILREHKNEYIFFKTENKWTTRGAYYGADIFLREMDEVIEPLEAYDEFSYNSFGGEMKYMEKICTLEPILELEDHFVFYRLPGTINAEEVFCEENTVSISYKRPLIAPSYINSGVIVETDYIKAIVEGKTICKRNEGKYLLVVCDSAGKLIVPYLKDYYDGVYVVNVMRHKDFLNEIRDVVENFNISEILYIQDAMKMGEYAYSAALNPFVRENVIVEP